jgi:hypothetical protein
VFRLFCLLYTLILFSTFCYSHESNKAFFKITQNDKKIIINAEFPWTIRKALIEYNPQLENATTKEDFIYSLKKYLKQNLSLKDNNDVIIELTKLTEIENPGHSHQSNYLLEYRGNNLQNISNTLLFNINNVQKNYHQIIINNTELKFITSTKHPIFKLPKKEFSIYWILLLIIPMMVILFFVIKKRNF